MDLQKAVLQMKIEVNNQFQRSPNFNYERGNRMALLEKIENLVLEILTSINENQAPKYTSQSTRGAPVIISFGNKKSRSKFATITSLLSEIYVNLTTQQSKTKR